MLFKLRSEGDINFFGENVPHSVFSTNHTLHTRHEVQFIFHLQFRHTVAHIHGNLHGIYYLTPSKAFTYNK